VRATDIVTPGKPVRFVFVVLSPSRDPVAPGARVPIKGHTPSWAASMTQYLLPLELEESALARARDDVSTALCTEEVEMNAAPPRPFAGYKRRRLEEQGEEAEMSDVDSCTAAVAGPAC
jgi:hypothetical protein